MVSDIGDTLGNRDAGQAGAASERIIFNAGDAIGNRDAGQPGTASKRFESNVGDGVGDRIAADFAFWTLDQHRLVLIEQNSDRKSTRLARSEEHTSELQS